MVKRRFVMCAVSVGMGALAVAPAFAFQTTAFDNKAFETAQAEGKSILIEITAPWCPTCKAQRPILSELSRKPKFKDLVALEIDFDSQKDLLRKFGVQMQGTLIAFKGAKEVGRSAGDTKPSSIEAQLDKSL